MELRPAHETMLEQILHHCGEIEALNGIICEGPPTHLGSGARIPSGAFEMGLNQNIGALCSLLETLKKTIIPANKLDEVIAGLAGIKYRHAAIIMAIQSLRERNPQPVQA